MYRHSLRLAKLGPFSCETKIFSKHFFNSNEAIRMISGTPDRHGREIHVEVPHFWGPRLPMRQIVLDHWRLMREIVTVKESVKVNAFQLAHSLQTTKQLIQISHYCNQQSFVCTHNAWNVSDFHYVLLEELKLLKGQINLRILHLFELFKRIDFARVILDHDYGVFGHTQSVNACRCPLRQHSHMKENTLKHLIGRKQAPLQKYSAIILQFFNFV